MSSSVLITGATDGIGLELARLYAADGARLILLGRRPLEDLDATLFTPETYCRVDLGEADVSGRLLAFLEAQGIDALDLVVHNAALGSYGPIEEDPPEQISALLAVNLRTPIALTHALFASLLRGQGKVVFVSSVVESLACADYAVYAATKAALNGFARSLRIEWKGRIDVQVIHPGAVRTAFHAKARVPEALVSSPRIPSATKVARSIQRIAEGNRATPTLGLFNALLHWLGRHGERPLDWLMRRSRS